MKIKLSPELSYVIGFWRKVRTMEGIGVKGSIDILEVFSKEVLEQKLTSSDKLLSDGNRIYFYHTAYRRFFQEVEEEQLERFKYLNEYAASYIAGMFDAVGSVDDRGVVSFKYASKHDEMMFLRLGFGTRRREGRLVVERPLVFLAFIKNYVKIFKGHKVFDYVKGKVPVPKSAE